MSTAELNANERLRSADLTLDDYLNHFIRSFRRLPRQIYRREKQERLDIWRREKKPNHAVSSRHVVSVASSVNMRLRVNKPPDFVLRDSSQAFNSLRSVC